MPGRGWGLLAAGAGLLGLAVVLAVNLFGTAPRELGSNLIRPLAFDVVLQRGQEVCEPVPYIPAGTAGIEVRAGTFGRPGPALRARIAGAGAAAPAGRLAAGWPEGDIVVPLAEVERPLERASVCLRNAGSGRVALAGHSIGPGPSARVDGREAGTHIRVEYVRAGSGSWLSRTGFVADRVGATRAAFPGAATFWLWAFVALGVVGGAVALVLRGGRA